ncbi:phosphate ABC transporter permease PstA [Microbacter margulisiae]|uniref:Phosphate transport system permease protein PstA n=1 Tax=Microbacter margulisiae TaxID=1350067 RepID=A0A7W5DSG3_9PORP|nr:phosphate ABC transporter permease PstA [Microbacter margulisiae]MBB3188234.1 phosphate transport system permease protein [Microbacter margulisiae]
MDTSIFQRGKTETKSAHLVRSWKNKIFFSVVLLFALITISIVFLIIGTLVAKGYRQINWSFFTQVAPDTFDAMMANASGRLIPGGILNGITGSIFLVAIASILAIPIGVIIGIFLYENPHKRYANLIRDIADVLQGVPSIVIGLIVYLWVVVSVTKGYSALAGSVALAIMMLPLIIRSTEESMKMVPESLKEAAVALGTPYYKVILRVLIPSSFSGLITGILLAVSRVLGETAPLLLTTLGNSSVNWNLSKPISAVPLLIWQFYNDPNMVNMIWSSSLFLMAFVLILNILSKWIAAKKSIQ